MENNLVMAKVFVFLLLDAFLPMDALMGVNEILRFVFYGIGIYVLASSAYDTYKKRKL